MVLFFEVLLGLASLLILWFGLYVIYRLVTDDREPGRACAGSVPVLRRSLPSCVAAQQRRSGDRAVADAVVRAQTTGGRNIPVLPDLPLPEDTANLRLGPDLDPALLALLPMVGVWRGEGEGNNPGTGDYRFGQEIVVAHDGSNYLTWDSRSWVLDRGRRLSRPGPA